MRLTHARLGKLSRIGLVLETTATSSSKAGEDDYLSGVDLFCLRYRNEFPTSLVITARALSKYYLLFRHLFRVKHAQTRLHRVWIMSKSRLVYLMSHVLQTFAHYVSFEVVEPHWRVFVAHIKSASRVDEITLAQDLMLDSCLRESLLTSPRLIAGLNALLDRCSHFCKLVEQEEIGNPKDEGEVNLAGFRADMKEFLASLIKEARSQGDVAMGNLARRMDWDGFFV